MKIKGIRILDKKNNIISVELPEILEQINDGDSFFWSVLYLYATGDLGEKQSIPFLEQQIKKSERGLLLSWNQLNDLANKFWDLIDITIIGCKDQLMLKKYQDDQQMHEKCDIVIEMIDSGCWEIFSKDLAWIDQLGKKYKKVEFIFSDFQSE